MSLKSPEAVARSALVADTAVAALLGSRVFPVLAPASAAQPFATYRRSGVLRQQTLSGPMGMPTVNMALDLYAETYEAVRDLADKCRKVLDGYGATLNNVEVKHVSLQNEADGFVQLAGGELPPVYSVSQTYAILWQEI
jgi:hypothetical protein